MKRKFGVVLVFSLLAILVGGSAIALYLHRKAINQAQVKKINQKDSKETEEKKQPTKKIIVQS